MSAHTAVAALGEGRVQILCGDALSVLRTLPSESVQVCVTSPPFYQLRDYGVDGQIGLEETPGEFLEKLWAVFDEVRRVLHPSGLVFCNIGDSYAGSGRGPTGYNGIGDQRRRQGFIPGKGGHQNGARNRDGLGSVAGIPAKNLLLIPQRFAIGMQERGWIVRSEIVWHKKSCMPESVRDRMTSAWEPIWMFSKSARYYFDQDAVRQPGKGVTGGPKLGVGTHSGPSFSNAPHLYVGSEGAGASLRNVWLLGPEPSREEHYAAFPSEIPRRCILAGSRPGDTVLDPFLGSGTTALVAHQLGRNAIGVELNPEYAEMARRRIAMDAPMLTDGAVTVSSPAQASLWPEVAG